MARPIFGQKNIMVVGGAGFIGSHLCDELVRDHKVICVDNFITGDERNIDHLLQNSNFAFIRHDITEPLPLEGQGAEVEHFKVAWQGVQEIYYVASPTTINDIERLPVETLLANSMGVYRALELARVNKATFCFVSSDSVYGFPPNGNWQFSEHSMGVVDPLGARSQYVEGKRFGEALVTAYHHRYGVPVRIARVFHTYGPRLRLEDAQLVPVFVRSALANEPLVVYGGAEAMGAYCYVGDIVKGLLLLMAQGDELPVNLGAEHPEAIVDLAKEIIAQVGSASHIEMAEQLPKNYHPQPIPIITRARESLGWFPVVRLNEGLLHTVEYLKASRGLIDVKTMA